MGADFLSTGVSSGLMSLDPWIPMMIGLGITMTGVLMTTLLPETLNAEKQKAPDDSNVVEMVHLSPDDSEDEYERRKNNRRRDRQHYHAHSIDDIRDSPVISSAYSAREVLTFLSPLLRNCGSSIVPYKFIVKNRQIVLLLTAFLVYRLSRGSSWFLVQYISTRHGWSIANANLLVSFKHALTVPLFLFLLPMLSSWILRYMSPSQKDILLARCSIVSLMLGTLGIALSPSIFLVIPSLILQTCGAGFVFFTRSLITTLVKHDETARLYTVIEAIQAAGNVIASIALTNVFQLGVELGGAWIGLAWMTTSSLFFVVAIATFLFRLPTASGVSRVVHV